MKILLGKQHFIENFNFDTFIKGYKEASAEEQFNFINEYYVETNSDWLKAKRGKLGASVGKQFLADSVKVSGMKRTKKYQEANDVEKAQMISEIPVDEMLGETCKDLAYKILAERNSNYQDNMNLQTIAMKRGLVFEQFSTELYEKTTGLKTQEAMFCDCNDLMGFSPDRIVLDGDKKVVLEIKNFEAPNFYKAVLEEEKPETIAQIQFQMYMGNLDRVDVIYSCFETGNYFIKSHTPDQEYMNQFAIREKAFREYLNTLQKKIEFIVKI